MFYSAQDAISWARLYNPFPLRSSSDFDTKIRVSRHFEYDKRDLWASIYYSTKRAAEKLNPLQQKAFILWVNGERIADIKKQVRKGQDFVYSSTDKGYEHLEYELKRAELIIEPSN